MNPRLQIALLSLLLACCAPLAAQDPADSAYTSNDVQAAASDAANDASAATVAGTDGDSVTETDAEAVAEAADEPAADAAAEDGAATDPGALVEEDARVAASAEDEFNPDEEISEDYPVPLPSDI